jgi:hypothetical protein
MRLLTLLLGAFAIFILALFAPLLSGQETASAPDPVQAVAETARRIPLESGGSLADLIETRPVAGKNTAEVRFKHKEGYRFDDLVRFLRAIEKRDSRLRISFINFGQRDEGTDIWRPLAMAVRMVSRSDEHPLSALARLEQVTGVIEKRATNRPGLSIDRLDVSEASISWSMRYPATDSIDDFWAELKLLPGAGEITRGKVSDSAGTVREQNLRMAFITPGAPHPAPDMAPRTTGLEAFVREAIRSSDPEGKTIEIRGLTGNGQGVTVTLAFAGVSTLGRFVFQLQKENRTDGLLVEQIDAEGSGGRILVIGRVNWNH